MICTIVYSRVPSMISGVLYCRASRAEVTSFATLREIPLELAPTFLITKETSFEDRGTKIEKMRTETIREGWQGRIRIRKKRCERNGRLVEENEKKIE